jgi:Pyridoxamine 5'-phosphate oxidase
MPQPEPRKTTNLATLYAQELMPWSRATEALGNGSLGPEGPCFLATVRPDGRPHSAGVGVAVHDGELFFTSGPAARKARNLAANPACTLSIRRDGIDLVFEGEARRETDPVTLSAVAAGYREGGWPAQVDGDALAAPYSAQSAGPGPWHLYRLRTRTVFGVSLREPAGASRWDF